MGTGMVTGMVTGGMPQGLKDCIQNKNSANDKFKSCSQWIQRTIDGALKEELTPEVYNCVFKSQSNNYCTDLIHTALFDVDGSGDKLDQRIWHCLRSGSDSAGQCKSFISEKVNTALSALGIEDMRTINNIISKVDVALNDYKNIYKPLITEYETKIAKYTDTFDRLLDEYEPVVDDAVATYRELKSDYERYRPDIDKVVDTFEDVKDDYDQMYAPAIKDIIGKYDEIKDKIEPLTEKVTSVVGKVEEAIGSLGNALEGEGGSGGFAAKIKDFIAGDIGKCLVKPSKESCKPLIDTFSKGSGGLFDIKGMITKAASTFVSSLWPVLILLGLFILILPTLGALAFEKQIQIRTYIVIGGCALLVGWIVFVIIYYT